MLSGVLSQEISLLRLYRSKGVEVSITLLPNFHPNTGDISSLEDKIRLALERAREQWIAHIPDQAREHGRHIFEMLEVTLKADLIKNPSLLDSEQSKNKYFSNIF